MCQKITILTEVSHTRYVSQCEHGTVHLLWDAVGIHLNEASFRRLAENMARTWAERPTNPYRPVTKMWLKVAQMVLHIEVFEFAEILDMVQTALLRMDEGGLLRCGYITSLGRAPKKLFTFRLINRTQTG